MEGYMSTSHELGKGITAGLHNRLLTRKVRRRLSDLFQTMSFVVRVSVYLLGSCSLCRLASPASLSTWQK